MAWHSMLPQAGLPRDMFPPELYDNLRKGKLIHAIKVYREVTGVSLAEAKAAVEAMAAEMR